VKILEPIVNEKLHNVIEIYDGLEVDESEN
jgi:hypothetical protein